MDAYHHKLKETEQRLQALESKFERAAADAANREQCLLSQLEAMRQPLPAHSSAHTASEQRPYSTASGSPSNHTEVRPAIRQLRADRKANCALSQDPDWAEGGGSVNWHALSMTVDRWALPKLCAFSRKHLGDAKGDAEVLREVGMCLLDPHLFTSILC